MNMSSINQKDLTCGLLFIFFGAVGFLMGLRYDIGTALHMGPGYFPVIISSLLLFCGVTQSVKALRDAPARLNMGSFKVFSLPLVGILAFAYLIIPAGYAAASFVLLFLTYCVSGRFKLIEFVALYGVLVLVSYLLFKYFLDVSFTLLPN